MYDFVFLYYYYVAHIVFFSVFIEFFKNLFLRGHRPVSIFSKKIVQ
jgi:hypothetical protein